MKVTCHPPARGCLLQGGGGHRNTGLSDFIDILQTLRSHLREEEDILNSRRICHKHCKTVDSHTES